MKRCLAHKGGFMKLKKFLIGLLSIASVFTLASACRDDNEKDSSSPSSSSSIDSSVVPTCTHVWSDWTETSAPNCTTAGEAKRACSLCEETETKSVDPLGHIGVWEVLTPATCTTAGEKKTDCIRCQQNGVTQVIKPLGHSGLWHVIQLPDCDSTGEKDRTCTVCNEYEKVTMDARGHSYENGGCTVCGAPPLLPTDAGNTTLLQPTDGDGSEYNRFECREGYYELEIPSNDGIWLSFAISQPGQYALYSVNGANGCSIERYHASAHWVNGTPTYTAITLGDGNIYTSFSCPDKEFSKYWRATYKLIGAQGKTVTLRFVRIAELAWQPDVYEEIVTAKEIDGKAQDGAAGTVVTEVPLTTNVLYNSTTGFYEMPTGETVYVAITAAASRLLGEGTNFISTLETANPFSLSNGTTEEGDYYVKNYAFFITNYQYGIENGRSYFLTDDEFNYISNPSAICYQNFVNKDGYYPLTEELKAFLQHYVRIHPPVSQTAESPDENAWLAACYYYEEQTLGTENNPQVLLEGDNEVSLKQGENYSATITATGTYTLTCTDPDVTIQINGTNYTGEGYHEVELNGETYILIWCDSADKTTVITFTKSNP